MSKRDVSYCNPLPSTWDLLKARPLKMIELGVSMLDNQRDVPADGFGESLNVIISGDC